MMYEQTLQEVTYLDYPIQTSFTPSTGIEEIDIPDIWENLLFSLIRKQYKKQFYYNFSPLFEVDLSSINPRFEITNETSFIEKFEKTILEDILEFDVVIRMPPIKEWSVRVKVKSVEKATPRIVEPEGI